MSTGKLLTNQTNGGLSHEERWFTTFDFLQMAQPILRSICHLSILSHLTGKNVLPSPTPTQGVLLFWWFAGTILLYHLVFICCHLRWGLSLVQFTSAVPSLVSVCPFWSLCLNVSCTCHSPGSYRRAMGFSTNPHHSPFVPSTRGS